MKRKKGLWVDFDELNRIGMTFNFICGGRGTGKTYGALKYAYDHGQKLLLIRRTQTELETMAGNGIGDANPYKAIERDTGIRVEFRKINKYLYGLTDLTNDPEEGELIGYAAALSTFSRLRGVDFSDVDTLVYDEFIAELHVKRMAGEADAFFNLYETSNRNREFDGGAPVRCWFLSNSNNIYTPLFVSLGLVGKVEQMTRRGQEYSVLADRSVLLVQYYNEEFAEKKRKTALYKLTEGTDFAAMALGNDFAYNDFSLIERRDVTGMRPICSVEDMTLYRSKDGAVYYVSYAKAKTPPRYTFRMNPQEKLRFRESVGIDLFPYFIHSRLWFESYDIKQRWLSFMLLNYNNA